MESLDPVHLLLTAPGQEPVALPPSHWSMWVLTPQGAITPDEAAALSRAATVSPRNERALVTAAATVDLDALSRLATHTGPASEVARLLMAGHLGNHDPASAIAMIEALRGAGCSWSTNKTLRRVLGALHVHVSLAPGVPALLPIGPVGLGLKQAELLATMGLAVESIEVLESLPPEPAPMLALAASLLANGQSQRVMQMMSRVQNIDDATALILVACSVAARVEGDLNLAFDAVTAALSVPFRHPAVIAGALEERAHLSSLARDDMAVRADLEALAALSGGAERVDVPTLMRRKRTEEDEKVILARARTRMRRRIGGTGEPGTFGGRHHTTYREEIVDMFALGQATAAEELLLGLLDSVEDEVAELGVDLDPTFFLTLADLYQDSSRTEDLRALRERFEAAEARAQRATGDEGERGRTLYPVSPTGVEDTSAPASESPMEEAAPVIETVTEQELEAALASAIETVWPDDSADPHERDRLPRREARHQIREEVAWAPHRDVPDVPEIPDVLETDDGADGADDGADDDLSDDLSDDRPQDPSDDDTDHHSDDEPSPPKPERELTPVERAIRGPRLRTL